MKPAKSKSTGGSYELFDLANDEDDHPPPQETKLANEKRGKPVDVIDLVEKVPKSRAVSLASAAKTVPAVAALVPPVSSSLSNTLSIEKTSSWLDRFVTSKRTYVDPSETVPDIEVSNDDYLREFSTSFTTNVAKVTSNADDFEVELDPLPLTDVLALLDQAEKTGEEKTQQSTATINLYNLPYTCTADEVSLFVEQCGGKVKIIEMGSEDNKKKNLKAGSAFITIEDVSVKDVLASINKSKINGRLIRAQRVGGAQDIRRRSSLNKDNGRYFVADDISFKCNSCGQVGHKVADCTNDPLPVPCHLCAGPDHEPVDCPNIICYRCGRFGHHSRDCRNSSGVRAMICFQCGANDHVYLLCPEFLGMKPTSLYDSLVMGPQVQCIDCRKFGHVTCRPIKASTKDKQNDGGVVYCYNCGEEGHHVDFPSISSVINDEEDDTPPRRHHQSSERKAKKKGKKRLGICLAPRYEAFMRFPQLQKDYEFLKDDEKEDYYQRLVRHYNDRTMFPVLQDPPFAYAAGGCSNKKRYRDEEDDYYKDDDDDELEDEQRWSRHDNNQSYCYDDSYPIHKKQRRHSDNNFSNSGERFKQQNNNASSSSSSNHRRFSDGGGSASGGGSYGGQKRERDEPDRNWKKFQEQQHDDFDRKKKQRQDRFRNDRDRDD